MIEGRRLMSAAALDHTRRTPIAAATRSGSCQSSGDRPSASRVTLVAHDLTLVESLSVESRPHSRAGIEDYSPDYQVCLPYAGAFVWHVGRDDVVADPNGVLFVRGGEGFRVSQPVAGGYAELIFTVRPDLLSELLGVPERTLSAHECFRRRRRPANADLQRRGADFLHRPAGDGEPLASEERIVAFLQAALAVTAATRWDLSPSTIRMLGRAKAYLAANLSAPLRLAHVARAAGTSPAYLTTTFRLAEGQPLHRYLVQLRLARALVELPHADDLTRLACELGFSNHSHFTAAFRRMFGLTPSRFRERGRHDVRYRTASGWR